LDDGSYSDLGGNHVGIQKIAPRRSVIVDDINIRIERGETFCLLGESGCGKSMTALSILRLLPPGMQIAGGSIKLDGDELLALSDPEMVAVRGRRIGIVFQEPQTSLNPVLSIGVQIAETLHQHLRIRGAQLRENTVELLSRVGIPDPQRRFNDFPHRLSGGMQQRVMLAIALAGQPDLLIADEPTTALDVTIQAQILELLRDLQRERGMGVLLISHDLGVVAEMADRVAVMYAGEIVEQVHKHGFFSAPAHPYTQSLFAAEPTMRKRGSALAVPSGGVASASAPAGGCRYSPRCAEAFEPCKRPPRLLSPSVGLQVRCHLYSPSDSASKFEPSRNMERLGEKDDKNANRPGKPGPAQDNVQPESEAAPMLKVVDLGVSFPIRSGWFNNSIGWLPAVDGLSLEIEAGTTLALVGESGCGKTTAGKSIARLIPSNSGQIEFDGQPFSELEGTALRRRRADIQFIFQDSYAAMNPGMRAGRIIEEGIRAHNVDNIGSNRRARDERVDALLISVGLTPADKFRYPHQFSGGQRQRICIARALAVQPKLIICDEPTSALDVSVQAQILNLLQELQQTTGLAYLFITHDLSVVEYLADRVAVMYLGRIVESGSVQQVLTAPQHPYTKALLAAAPVLDADSAKINLRLRGELPISHSSAAHGGCHFEPRCPLALAACRGAYPEEIAAAPGHLVRCIVKA